MSVTSTPRTRPSVGCIEIVRTKLSPRCCATSSVRVFASSSNVTSALQRVEQLRHGTPRELDVDDGPGDPYHAAAGVALVDFSVFSVVSVVAAHIFFASSCAT